MPLVPSRPARSRAVVPPRGGAAASAPPHDTRPPAASSDPTTTTTNTNTAPDTTTVTIILRAVPAASTAARGAAAVAFSHRAAAFEAAPPADGACIMVGSGTGTLVRAETEGGSVVAAASAAAPRPPPPASGVFGPRAKAAQAGAGAAAASHAEAQVDVPPAADTDVQTGPADGTPTTAAPSHPSRSVAAAARFLTRVTAAAANRGPAVDAISWDDPADARSPTAASLLPLWSLPPLRPTTPGRRSAPLPVSALAWAPTPPCTALAVAYGRTSPGAPGGGGVAVWAPRCDAGTPVWHAATPATATALAFEPSGGRLAVGFANGSVCVFEDVGGQEEEENGANPSLRGGAAGAGHAAPIASLAWLAPDTADGALLATTGADGVVMTWRAARGGVLAPTPLAALPADAAADADPSASLPPAALVGGTCLSVAPPPHDGALLIGDDGGGARVVVAAAGVTPAASFSTGASTPLVAASWSPVTRGAFMTVAADGRVGVWQAARREVRVLGGELGGGTVWMFE